MHGENLPAVLRDMHRKLAEGLVNADVEFTVIPDAGHAANIDNPQVFSTTVREFLAERVYSSTAGAVWNPEDEEKPA